MVSPHQVFAVRRTKADAGTSNIPWIDSQSFCGQRQFGLFKDQSEATPGSCPTSLSVGNSGSRPRQVFSPGMPLMYPQDQFQEDPKEFLASDR